MFKCLTVIEYDIFYHCEVLIMPENLNHDAQLLADKKTDWEKRYRAAIAERNYAFDPAQLPVMDEFARIDAGLSIASTNHSKQQSGFFSRLFATKPSETTDRVKGLYLFGTVGRGKTFMTDLFVEQMVSEGYLVKRMHFHHFMKYIHDTLRDIKGEENPLNIVAKDFAKQSKILVLDEFMVTDITDAMLLYGLLKALLDCGVVMLTTSNIVPDDLYKNGLQRERFFPAIELIKKEFVVHEIGHGQDFRRLSGLQRQRFFSPNNAQATNALLNAFDALSFNLPVDEQGVINVYQRDIQYVRKSDEVIWFDFAALCETNRSQLDYLKLAEQFGVFIISDIPVLDVYKEDAAKRFLLLVDELYDRRIGLLLSSAVPIESIYQGKRFAFEFARVQSRLFEMQNENYGL